MSSTLARMAFDHSLRTEKIIHLATMCATASMADIAEEALNDDWNEIMNVLGVTIADDAHMETLAEQLMDKNLYGFLVNIATPVPTHFSNGGYSHYGFGIYTTKWFYGESMDDIYAQAAKWQTEYIEKKRTEAAAKESSNG